jgi:hypothetical protein
MFVDFEDPITGEPIAINSDHVRAVRPGRDKGTSVLFFGDDLRAQQQEVWGEFQQIIDKLNGNRTLTLLPYPRNRTRESKRRPPSNDQLTTVEESAGT